MTRRRPVVLCLGTLDTKGPETRFIAESVRAQGCDTLVLDCGILGEPQDIVADITREEAARAAGTTIEALRQAGSRGVAIDEMIKGVKALGEQLHQQGRIDGVVALGGAEGSVLAAATMTSLPVGLPKLLVSPIASGRRNFGPFVGTRDVTVMHSVVDILGLNSIAMEVYENAASAIAGMASAHFRRQSQSEKVSTRLQVAATMLGNTTKPLMWIRQQMAADHEELVIFHANGVGGAAMEESLDSGRFQGVIDYTLSELAGEVAGGFHVCDSCERLSAASRLGLPQVVVPGCVDFSVHGAPEEVPESIRERPSYYHNPEFTLVRLTTEEQCEVGRRIVSRLNASTGEVIVVLPLQGLSVSDRRGGVFEAPEISLQFQRILHEGLREGIEIREVDAHINDQACAEAVLSAWQSLASGRKVGRSHVEGEA
ncbi:MAG: hypothetical protein CMJ39_12805 [Phycisphaerae bacterium]|nr:hypothetical protein [Phycisphaerae bacterium]